jgi:hypothetical protein
VNQVGIEVGQYVRTSTGVGYVFGKTESQFEIALVERDEERSASASELTLWKPKPGERVAEANNEYGVTGTVVEAGEEISLVRWDSLRRHVSFVNSGLEPASH